MHTGFVHNLFLANHNPYSSVRAPSFRSSPPVYAPSASFRSSFLPIITHNKNSNSYYNIHSTTTITSVSALSIRASVTTFTPAALIFDCDGVILESESLHREAYNQAFREFQVEYNWSPEYYDELQNKVGGGKPKMHYYFGIHGYPASKLGPKPQTAQDKEALVDALQDRKTDIYKEFVSNGTAKRRPGITRLINEAIELKTRLPEGTLSLAICSASTKSSCFFVLDNLLGKQLLNHFDVVLAGDDVNEKKPHPMIYNKARELMGGIDPARCIVIEDSLIGLQAANAAGMKCIITYTDSTESQDFAGAGAAGVFSELGDPPSVQVTLKDLFPDLF